MREAASQAALAMFVDAHNTGYLVNSYTTKLNPTMDGVLQKLLDGVRRLQDDWAREDSKEACSEVPPGQASGPHEEAVQARSFKNRQAFRRTMQVLSRFETCFRRASWKSGAKMVFPILFEHLSFTTHRCWTVFMRKAIYLSAQAWRQAYGQVATQRPLQSAVPLQYKATHW